MISKELSPTSDDPREQRFRLQVEAIDDYAIYMLDHQGRVDSWNKGAERIKGYTRGEIMGQHFSRFYTPEDRQAGIPQRALAIARERGKFEEEGWRMRKDGSRFWASVVITPIRDANGRLLGYTKVVHDLTEQNFVAERFRMVFERSPSGMILVDEKGKIVLANPQVAVTFGYGQSELVGQPIEMLVPLASKDSHETHRARFAIAPSNRNMGKGRELTALHKNGTDIPVEIGLNPITTARGVAVLCAITDITERQAAEKKLREADQRKDEFLALLAHELRNPLAAIAGAVTLLNGKESSNPESALVAEVLDRQVNHLTRIVDDLLDVSRITRGLVELRKEPVQLGAAVEHALDAVRPAADERQQRLEVSLPGEPVWVEGDLTRLAQVASNLLSNAVKYTPQGGSIWVSVETSGRDAVLQVRDNGRGISQEFLPHVFDLFARADLSRSNNPGGLGLGLSLVKRLVDMHGGFVEARSEGPGQGSSFCVRLPLLIRSEEQMGGNSGGAQNWVEPRATRILVVDDNPDIALTLTLLLQRAGHRVESAYNGESALLKLQDAQPEVVLLDIRMPGMDGYDVARAIRANPSYRQCKLIALTGFGQEQDLEKARAAGFDEHLMKPVQRDALLRAIGDLTRRVMV